jgi:hypothetical protein
VLEQQIAVLEQPERDIILYFIDYEIICNDCFWMSGKRLQNSSTFHWGNELSFTFENWHPNAWQWEDQTSTCVAIVEDGSGWSSMDCNTKAKFACERT